MATIIRQRGPQPSASGRFVQPVAFNFDDINDRANEYLDVVRREAAKIVQQAHQQAEQIRRDAEMAGRATADEAARKALEETMGQQLDTLFTAIEQIVVQLDAAKADWLRRWETSAVAVAAAIAQRIIRRELEHHPEISLEWIREALRLAAGGGEIVLRLNPTDRENLGQQVERVAQAVAQLAPSQIVADPAVTPGGCVVESRFGRVDQQIEAQLARIEEELE